MEIPAEIQHFCEKFRLKHNKDHRREEEKQIQAKLIEKITLRNLEALRINLTEKRSVKYKPRMMQKVDLGERVYCYVTDNLVDSEYAVMTFHGLKGSCSQWAGIETEMREQLRWVNFAIPGFDG